MKLASLKSSRSRDGELVIVNRAGRVYVSAGSIAPSLQAALDDWKETKPRLLQLADCLEREGLGFGGAVGISDFGIFHSPLPRAYQWLDGSAFLHHVRLVRRARNAPIPESLTRIPLMYQGGSDSFLGPRDPIPCLDESFGLDIESEVAVITSDVPLGVSAEKALDYVQLLVLVNDVSLRGLIPEEIERGFGFLQGKPSSAFSPFALTPDELGDAWSGGRFCLPLRSEINGEFFGNPDASQMHFHFGELLAHAARTRSLTAGTIVGSGTVSNEELARGSSCIVEKRMLEKLAGGEMKSRYLRPGDRVKIWMEDAGGRDLFGVIEQEVVAFGG